METGVVLICECIYPCNSIPRYVRAAQQEMAKDEVDILAFSLNFCQARSEATFVIGPCPCKNWPRLSHQRLLESWSGPEPEIPGREAHHVDGPRPIGKRPLDALQRCSAAACVDHRSIVACVG